MSLGVHVYFLDEVRPRSSGSAKLIGDLLRNAGKPKD